MSFLKGIVECLTASKYGVSSTGHSDSENKAADEEERRAAEILRILFTAEKPDKSMREQLNTIVHANNWYEGLAKRILDSLIKAVESGAAMGSAMKEAFDKASKAANDFVEKHPVFAAAIVTVVAIGICVLLVPWVVEVLGFGELGPIAGSWAARWQSTFPNVEARSFFAYLQRLGMKWGRWGVATYTPRVRL